MFGLTQLGIIHTAISLLALATGAIALIRNGKITLENKVGKIYVITTIITCLTGFGIFQHGGFGKPHALGIITLLVLGVAYVAKKREGIFGEKSVYVEVVGYTATFLFHLIPGITETLTRLPLDAPLAASPEDALVKKLVGFCFILFLALASFQIRRIKQSRTLSLAGNESERENITSNS